MISKDALSKTAGSTRM